MPVMIQLRNVPDALHRKLKARAAAAGMSLSAYILRDAERLAEQPTMEEWMAKVKKLRPLKLRESTVETIRAIRDVR
jgi:plasmid stability protein